MTYREIIAGALCAALWATSAASQTTGAKPTDSTPPARTFKDAVEKTRPNTGTRPLPATEVAVLHLVLHAENGKLREAMLQRMLVVRANPPKVFARSRGTWEVQLLGENKARYRIQNPLNDVEVENSPDSRSPFSKVTVNGPLPFDLVVPLARDGKNLAVQRIRIVDTESEQTVIDTPVRRQ
jgi:hypothetical protein